MNDSTPHHGNREQPAASRLLLAVRREPDAVVLVLDGGEDLELAPEALPADLPGPGAVLDGPLLAALRAAAERKRAARRLFAILDQRLVPPARLRRKLADEGYDPAAVDAVLEQMAARGLYSDRHYADAWCRQCLGGKAVGRRFLENKLREKGIAGETARAAAEAALDRGTEQELAAQAATARWRRVRGPADRRAEAAVVRYLQGRGFDAGLAFRAARQARPTDVADDEGDDT